MTRLLPFLILALPACVARTDPALSVRHVVENAHALDGRIIAVRGWIEYCHRLSCPLFGSSGDVDREWGYFLSIAPAPWFDAFARRTAPREIVLRARLHDRCITNPATGVIAACADRSGTLEPLALVR